MSSLLAVVSCLQDLRTKLERKYYCPSQDTSHDDSSLKDAFVETEVAADPSQSFQRLLLELSTFRETGQETQAEGVLVLRLLQVVEGRRNERFRNLFQDRLRVLDRLFR